MKFPVFSGSSSKRFSLMMLTLLVMAAMGCIYYFLYLKNREATLDRHYTRAMQRIQTNVSAKITGLVAMVKGNDYSAAHAYKAKLDRDSTKKLTGKDSLRILDMVRRNSRAPWAKSRSGLDLVSLEPSKAKNDTTWMQVDTHNNTVFYFIAEETHLAPLRMTFRISLDSLLGVQLRNDLFDGFLVTRDDKVVQETFPSGLTVVKYDSLFTILKGNEEAQMPVMRMAELDFRCYVQPMHVGDEANWKIIGLKSAETFAEEKHDIPRNFRFSVFLLVLLAILALPFIKSLIMSRTERLKVSDVIFSVFSLLITVSLFTVLFFDGYLYYTVDKPETENRLRTFSDTIYQHVSREIGDIHTELKIFSAEVERSGDDSKKDFTYTPALYKTYSNIFMVSKSGQTVYDPIEPDYSFNVKEREYFSRIKDGNYFYLPRVREPFALEPIVSWREGKLRAAFSIPVDSALADRKLTAAVLTTSLQSLTAPVMPEGYGFCILDEKGNVIFHSDGQKSMNENFVEECDQDHMLIAALNGRATRAFDAQYSGNNYKIFVRPCENLPFFLVTFAAQDPLDNMHGQLFGVAMVLQIIVVLIYLVIAFVIYFNGRHETRLQVPRFGFGFFLPCENDVNRYLKATLFNVLHIVLLLLETIGRHQPIFLLFVFFTSPIYIVLLNYFLLAGKKLFARPDSKLLTKCIWITIVFLFVINISAIPLLELRSLFLFLLYQALLLLFYIVAQRLPIGDAVKRKTNHRYAYVMLVYTTILLISVIPVLRFAVLSYDREQLLLVKMTQLDLARAAEKRLEQNRGKNEEQLLPDSLGQSNYSAAFYNTRITLKNDFAKPETAEERQWDSLAVPLRASIQDAEIRSWLLDSRAGDTAWSWGKSKDGTLDLQLNSAILNRGWKKGAPKFISEVPQFYFPHWFDKHSTLFAFRFWLLLLVLMLLLYRVLRMFVRKLFAPEAFAVRFFPSLDTRFFKESRPEYRLFVTGLPCSGKSDYFESLYQSQENFHKLDLISCTEEDEWRWKSKVADALKEERGVLLIDHFEYNCLNEKINMRKLELLEELAMMPQKRVVIISAIHPQAFLELYSTPGATIPSLESNENMHTGDRWNKALSCFYNLWYPIGGVSAQEHELHRKAKKVPGEFRSIVLSECDHGFFLRKIGEELCNELENLPEHQSRKKIHETQEDIILKIQKLAHVYYLSIWSLLTKEEQYVLFDLAQDGLVNFKNLDVIETLANKGLVIYGDSLQPMNRSFQNFILTVIEPADLMKMEQSVRESGNWERFKKPLLIIVFALVVFLFRTDHNEMVTYITTFAAGIPLVINLITSIGKAGGKKAEK